MKIKLIGVLVVSAIVGLSGCGGSSDSASTPAASAPVLSVTNISGGTTDITGIWKGTCYSSAGGGSQDWMDTATFTGQTVSVETTAYTSTTLACTGVASVAGTLSADLTTQADEAITGWLLVAGGVATAPTALDTSGPISATATFTKATSTITAATGTFGAGGANVLPIGAVQDFSFVVDATAAPFRAYDINYASGASTAQADDFYTKQ